MSAAPS